MNNFSFLQFKHTIATIIFFFVAQLSVPAQTKTVSDRYPIIPYPAHLVAANGDFFINKNTSVVSQNEGFREDANALKQLVKEIGGITLRESENGKSTLHRL